GTDPRAREGRRRPAASHRRDRAPHRSQGLRHTRHAAYGREPRARRGALRRAPREALLRGARRVHNLDPRRRHEDRGRGRHCGRTPPHGLDEPCRGSPRHHPRRPRPEPPRQPRPRLGLSGERKEGARPLLRLL
ncbi:MAG: Nucleoside diphosphate kinase, partial [uncultured Rubrobacteraceae bacterium]